MPLFISQFTIISLIINLSIINATLSMHFDVFRKEKRRKKKIQIVYFSSKKRYNFVAQIARLNFEKKTHFIYFHIEEVLFVFEICKWFKLRDRIAIKRVKIKEANRKCERHKRKEKKWRRKDEKKKEKCLADHRPSN